MANVVAVERGSENTFEYRIFFKKDGKFISPWHDIPLHFDEEKKIFNMICEIPRWTNAKMEISTKDKLNPIKQDIKNSKLRFVANIFPHHGYIWNYGAFPQTWEDPVHIDKDTKVKGDNDPLDVLEIGGRVARRGEIIQVKILGVLAMIDEGETDWKVVAIDVKDPLASKINDINDVDTYFPDLLSSTRNWFKIYKKPDGKPESKFGFNGDFKPKDFALKIIEETNEFWRRLVKGEISSGLCNLGVNAHECSKRLTDTEASAIVATFNEFGPPQAMPEEIQNWWFNKKT